MDNRVVMKSDNVELNRRINIIAEMLLKGFSKEKIVRYSSENFNVGERQTETYILKAKETIKQVADKNVEMNIALALGRFNDLYEKSYKIQDYRECRQVQESINKLLGLNEPEKVEQKLQVKPPINWVK